MESGLRLQCGEKIKKSTIHFETDTPPQGPLLAAAAPCRAYLFTHSTGCWRVWRVYIGIGRRGILFLS